MTAEITANFDELFRQAKGTAASYMETAVDNIDKLFGVGYAKRNPELVAAFMQVAGNDFFCTALAQRMRAGLKDVARAATSIGSGIGDAIKSLDQGDLMHAFRCLIDVLDGGIH